jgi:hypothetical protein
MTPGVTLPWATCKALARATWTRTRALAHATLEHAASLAHLDRAHLSRWESERCDHPVPLAVLWHPQLVPDDELEALVEQVRRDRAAGASHSPLAASPEGTLAGASRRATELLAGAVDALVDGRVSGVERRRLRPVLRELACAIRRTLRAWDDADRTEAQSAARPPPLRAVPGGAL